MKQRIFSELLRHVFKDDFEEKLIDILGLLNRLAEQETGMEYFETVIRYIMSAKEELSLNRLRKTAQKVSFESSEDIMTIAEKLRKKES